MPGRPASPSVIRVWRCLPALAMLLTAAPYGSGLPTAAEVAATPAEGLSLDLWPDGPPDPPAADIGPEQELNRTPPDGIVRLTNVTEPQITVFRPREPNGAAVLVCPGGGYKILALEHEGTDVCAFLNRHGVTAVLLKYRVPAPREQPLQDAQRALGLIHHHADDWGIDRKRIGILGFSAGGHLSIMTALHGRERTYAFDPAVDVEDPTPAFVIPIYPAYLVERGTEGPLVEEVRVTDRAPPMCLIHAGDDPWTASGSALLAIAYKQHGIPCELHIYSKGGHGFGMKAGPLPANAWPDRVIEWMRSMGYLAHAGGPSPGAAD